MLHLIKKLFGIVPSTPAVEAPYKVDAPAEVGKSVDNRVEAPAPVVTTKAAPAKKQPFEKKPVAPKTPANPRVPAKPRAKKAPAK